MVARHTDPSDTEKSTYRFRQLAAFVSAPINIALEINFATGEAGDLGFVQISLDEDSDPAVDSFGAWQRLEGQINVYSHSTDSTFTSSCKFDPIDDFFDASGGGVTNETTCVGQFGFSQIGSRTGSDFTNCTDSDGNGETDCGTATTIGPGFTEGDNVTNGVWVKSEFDLASFLGRRAQIRWLFMSLAFGDPTFLSYLETPSVPGGFDINENDDGWWIDDISISGLIQNQLNLIIDGGNDQVVPLEADVQEIPVGGACAAATDVVISSGADNELQSVGVQICPTDVAGFCNTGEALINGLAQATFVTSYMGSPFIVDGGASSLDLCVNGSIQYEYIQCNTTGLANPCDAPANGTILQGYSSDSQITVFPTTDTRYRVRVRCSSQPAIPGCLGSTDAIVRVYPGDFGGLIDIGSATVTCSVADTGDNTCVDGFDDGDACVADTDCDVVPPRCKDGIEYAKFCDVDTDCGLVIPGDMAGTCAHDGECAAGLDKGKACAIGIECDLLLLDDTLGFCALTSSQGAGSCENVVCDAGDAWQTTFPAVAQMGNLDGYDLYRVVALSSEDAPILKGPNAPLCQVADVPQAAVGTLILVNETDDGIAVVAPPVGDVHFYLVTHSRTTSGGVIPAGRGRPMGGGGFQPRFVNPQCQQPNP